MGLRHTSAYIERFIKTALRLKSRPHVSDLSEYLRATEKGVPLEIRNAIAFELESFATEKRQQVRVKASSNISIDELLRKKHHLLPGLAYYLRNETGPMRADIRDRIADELDRLAAKSGRKRSGLSGGKIRYRTDAVRFQAGLKDELIEAKEIANRGMNKKNGQAKAEEKGKKKTPRRGTDAGRRLEKPRETALSETILKFGTSGGELARWRQSFGGKLTKF